MGDRKGVRALMERALEVGGDGVFMALAAGIGGGCLPDGDTPLHVAAGMGKAGVCGRLLDMGADVDAGGWDGVTPLHRAVQSGDTETAWVLLEHGANQEERRRSNGERPVDTARRMGLGEMEGLLSGFASRCG